MIKIPAENQIMSFSRFIFVSWVHYSRKATNVFNKAISLSKYNNNKWRWTSQNKIPILLPLPTTLAFLWASHEEPHDAKKVEKTNIYQNADTLFESSKYEQCYEYLASLPVQDDVEIQWRICRVLYNISKEKNVENERKEKLIYQAFRVIALQLEKHPDHYAVHKWYALLLDAKSSCEGTKERIRQLEKVRKHMDLAVTLNPNDATTLHMLGEWCYQVADMPWHQKKIAEVLFAKLPQSSYEDALEYFLRAESVEPRFYSLNLLRLGLCYLKLKKEDQAKYYLKLAACYPAKSNDDHLANKEATEILKKSKLLRN